MFFAFSASLSSFVWLVASEGRRIAMQATSSSFLLVNGSTMRTVSLAGEGMAFGSLRGLIRTDIAP